MSLFALFLGSSFLAPPGFHYRVLEMRTLPLEFQTLIIKHLDARDIVHLQQACKGFNDLIKGNAEVWRACLKRLCHVEGLFWSSFNGLSTDVEYKNACTGIWRFKKRYRKCESSGGDMSHRSESRHLPVRAYGDLAEEGDAEADEAEEEVIYGDPHIKNPHPGIKGIYLVPGGRFLVTADNTWLLVWDLGPPGKKDAPAVWMQHRLDCIGSIKFLDVHIAENTALRIVLQEDFYGEVPPYIDPSQLSVNDDNTTLTTFHCLEVCLPENGDYAIKMQGRLYVARTDDDEIKAVQCGHTVALEVSADVILLWDTQGWTFSFWKLPEDSTFYMQQGYLFAITGEGVQVIDLTHSPRNLVTNQPVDLRSLSPASAPLFHSYEWPTELEDIVEVILPKSIPACGSVEYELQVGLEPKAYKTHRFSHDFNPQAPSSSTARSLGTPKSAGAGADLSEDPWIRFECGDGDWGYICEASPDISNISMTLQGNSGLLAHSEYSDPVSIMTPENESTIIQEVNVCPFSGRVVFLWDRRLLEDAMLEIVDYL
ncbi:hypothetical protein DFP72DRAFT_262627 [Ephemerocybe angulata]|uniref:F-box domain-containing protein n=1 Tax=Ephemerocybe angulata TaxID=980116 RepID=A0A8H6M6Q9_9AGAR|nr:hypothetical protein DFP72DRAFT_262627 [Tulosesus angulatus]